MTNEEAIEILQEEHDWVQEPCYVINAIKKAIAALSDVKTSEPLTIEQLRKMDGMPVSLVFDFELEPMIALVEYSEDDDCITMTNNLGGRSEFYSDEELRESGIKAYAYHPAHIDLEAWEPCELCCRLGEVDPCYKDGCFKENAPKCDFRCDKFLDWRADTKKLAGAMFCPKCGRPLTPEARAMLDMRLRG